MSGMTINVPHISRRPTRLKLQRTRPINLCPHCGLPITEAYTNLLDERVPNDLRRRTYVELIVEAVFRKAVKGNVRAAKEIREAVEGKVSQASQVEPTGAPEFKVIWPDREPVDQKRVIHSVPSKETHIESA